MSDPATMFSTLFGGEGAQALAQRKPDDLSALYKRVQIANTERRNPETLAALELRAANGREMIAQARTDNADPKRIKTAELKLAQLDDEISAAYRAEAAWYACSALYLIGRDFLSKLRPALGGSDGPVVAIHIPGVVTASLALDGPDDEPPF